MKLVLISVLVVSTLAACRSRRPDTVIIDRNDSSPAPTVVIQKDRVIEKDHAHGSTCGHYYHAGHWYYDSNHVHIID